MQLTDQYNRKVNYLRISVTDRCDLRCVYCMKEDMKFLPKSQILSSEEINTICSTFIDLGIKKIRITGGEPLIKKGMPIILDYLGKKINNSNEVENIVIRSITDNDKFSIDAIKLIYSLSEKSFVLINDGLNNIYLAYIKKIINENEISENDLKNYLLKSNSEIRDTLYSSYDIYLSEKY